MHKSKIKTLTTIPPFVALLATGVLIIGVMLWYGNAFGADGKVGAACDLPPQMEESDDMKTAENKKQNGPGLPGLDAILPGEVRTATFAMG